MATSPDRFLGDPNQVNHPDGSRGTDQSVGILHRLPNARTLLIGGLGATGVALAILSASGGDSDTNLGISIVGDPNRMQIGVPPKQDLVVNAQPAQQPKAAEAPFGNKKASPELVALYPQLSPLDLKSMYGFKTGMGVSIEVYNFTDSKIKPQVIEGTFDFVQNYIPAHPQKWTDKTSGRVFVSTFSSPKTDAVILASPKVITEGSKASGDKNFAAVGFSGAMEDYSRFNLAACVQSLSVVSADGKPLSAQEEQVGKKTLCDSLTFAMSGKQNGSASTYDGYTAAFKTRGISGPMLTIHDFEAIGLWRTDLP